MPPPQQVSQVGEGSPVRVAAVATCRAMASDRLLAGLRGCGCALLPAAWVMSRNESGDAVGMLLLRLRAQDVPPLCALDCGLEWPRLLAWATAGVRRLPLGAASSAAAASDCRVAGRCCMAARRASSPSASPQPLPPLTEGATADSSTASGTTVGLTAGLSRAAASAAAADSPSRERLRLRLYSPFLRSGGTERLEE